MDGFKQIQLNLRREILLTIFMKNSTCLMINCKTFGGMLFFARKFGIHIFFPKAKWSPRYAIINPKGVASPMICPNGMQNKMKSKGRPFPEKLMERSLMETGLLFESSNNEERLSFRDVSFDFLSIKPSKIRDFN
jgi:hypothetical protein